MDIETVPQYPDYNELNPDLQSLWAQKSQKINPEQNSHSETYFEKAGIFAEFGKIICISIGVFHELQSTWHFRVKSIAGHDELQTLKTFAELLHQHPQHILCAHNGKEFDYPYLCRRMVINGIPLPKTLHLAGKKPWEIKHLDTMELWKFGDYKNYTSLHLLASVLSIPTPKDDIKGSDVAQVYHRENNLERIVTYCQKDVITTARIFQKLNGSAPFPDENIEYV